ncbi:MAG TPA: hypothetical protein VMT20_24115 [Terriglobia bacterium]|nr:hypothetical protein [Terriglobia bacterium]
MAGMCVAALDEREADLGHLARRLVLSFGPQDNYEEMLLDQMAAPRKEI